MQPDSSYSRPQLGGSPPTPSSLLTRSDESLVRYSLGAVKPAWSPYVEIEFGAREADAYIEVGGSETAVLDGAIESHARRLGDVDRRIAASAFVFAYVKAMVVPAIATLVNLDMIPDLSADNASVRLTRSGAFLRLKSGRATTLPGDAVRNEIIDIFVEQSLDAHLLPLIDSIATRYGIARRVLRTNIAYVFCTQFGQLQLPSDLAQRRIQDALMFHAAAGPRFADSGEIVVRTAMQKDQLRFERANCCLYRLLPGEDVCDGCSETKSHRRRARRS